ncbi:aminopeptidase N [Novosphingobium mangrovi (ex Huang et al. 2023)]|uniref:Aminopeptidase N n=1 Tax=Novosphingobium mangrovi (ex Huang et al. 2023) TaxID=2976432 RepID=A0ABT2I173_9SPHN|nr:aminopeptidase N [Novosphingobium mangrovi (ex Huang et al. 2023)]MCT2398555.1 aminopeptidase N [Novosphingobium mangrovi (ex Huang et al. 2023)]
MDIASTPTEAQENTQVADAASPPQAPPVIRREDYLPPAWLVPEIALDFALGIDETRVVSKLKVVRNPDAAGATALRLHGDQIAALAVRVDGEAINDWRLEGPDLLVELPGAEHLVEVETQVNPAANSKLMGLYASNGMLCTQCEAEGFRRITFFPDRPDVLSTYSVRMTGDKATFPILLSNGNCTAQGEDADGAHWAEWHDPWPKPSYLFALVAGDLVANHSTFTTMSGREVDLNIWVRPGDEGRTQHAMDSLIASMKWDEQVFGREYDLDLFNIVAVSDFNMGAMENKGLNVFNTRYVLADPETATDGDYDAVEGVIGHEYFHNWSGNRITCRDWFQLSLKEGFTVLRDQLFSADMGSEAVKRIEDVRILRSAQFPEDSGPLAHPIRPDSYQEINNFYTATVYNKGAEVIRMMRTMAGPEWFRKGTDLYFERHDGEAATCEDFIKAIEDGAGLDLTQFRLWYSQAGTPLVSASLSHEGTTATVSLSQTVPVTPGQPDKKPMPIPLRIALFDRDSGTHAGEQLVVLDKASDSFVFEGFAKPPVLSINRGFSAPVSIDIERANEDLVFLAARDDDPFARYEAMQSLVVQHLVAAVGQGLGDAARAEARAAIGKAFAAILTDPALDDLMRGELMILPAESYLAEQMLVADPGAIHAEREALKTWLGREYADALTALHDRAVAVPYGRDAAARGARKIKNQALALIAAGNAQEGARRAYAQYRAADNMTDRQGALIVLASLDVPEREEALAEFHGRYEGNALVIDKWFSLQAGSFHPQVLANIRKLAEHPDFTMTNPNRVRALYMGAAMNPKAFHDASGEGYRLIGDLIRRLDPINPQTAARFVPSLGRWRRIESVRAAMMRAELEKIAAEPSLSRDVREQVTKSLG